MVRCSIPGASVLLNECSFRIELELCPLCFSGEKAHSNQNKLGINLEVFHVIERLKEGGVVCCRGLCRDYVRRM